MNIKFKNQKTSLFVVSFLSVVCSLLLSCKSSDIENTVFNKIVHPREYVFDIFDIDEEPKLKRERGSKKLIYSVDFSEYVKYDLPKAGDKLTLKYKGVVNKDVPELIKVSLGGLPADKTESYVFASNLNKNDIVADQVTFTLQQDVEEVVFNLKYDNPKKYFSLSFELEKTAETTDTKAEKKALEKAIKRGQQIVEISTVAAIPTVEYEQPEEQLPVETAPVVTEEVPVNTQQVAEQEAEEEILQEVISEDTQEGQLAVGKSITQQKIGKPISDIKESNFYKLTHPRLYYFDIYKIDKYPMLKREKNGNRLLYSVDFSKLAKEDMPKAGDKIIFIYEVSSTKDLPGIVYASLEGSSSEKTIFSTDLKKKQKTRNKITFLLKEDLDKIKLNLEYDNPLAYKSVILKMDRAIYSTDTGDEKKAYEKAVKQGRAVVEWKNDFTEKKKEEPEEPVEEMEEVPNEQEEQVEETTTEPTEITEPEETEELEETEQEEEIEAAVIVPAEHVEETPVQEEKQEEEIVPVVVPAIPEKTPDQLLAEERAKLQAEQALLDAERAKFEEDKAEYEAAKESDKQKELLEQEQLKQKQKLEETIEAVTNTNVKRYEKEYLNDYAVSGYTFDMEEKKPEPSTLFEDPDETNAFGVTLLMEAAKEGNDWKIKALINAGADVNLKDKDGWTALMYAVRYHGNMNCVELLIDAGADIKAQNNYGTSALILASNYNSNPEILKKLLSYYSPNEKDVLKSFIQVLTENQDDEYIQMIKVNLFLDLSVPLNSLFNGKTPLMYAAESGRSTKVIEMLLENSNTAIRSREGKTAFDYASENPKLKHDDIYWSLNNK